MLIAGGKLDRAAPAGEVVIVTGAGGGIGFEAARSLLYLGARVVIAEIDVASGREAEAKLAGESASGRIMFVATDVSDEVSVGHLCEATLERFGRIDVVLNNATYAPAGKAVAETPIDAALWVMSRLRSSFAGRVEQTLADQSKGWKERSFFKRQWMLRDFKLRVGMPVERCLETLALVEQRLSTDDPAIVDTDRLLLEKLGSFYAHLGELAQGYVKNPQQREEQFKIVGGWKADVKSLSEQIAGSGEMVDGRRAG